MGERHARELSRGRAGVVVSREQVREQALSLPEVIEQDHHGRPSFRVGGRILATLWDEGHMNVMLDEAGIHTAVQAHPECCQEFWWGKRLRAVHVDLATADRALTSDLLADAWERKAPKRLADAGPTPARGRRSLPG